ncbi:MAG: tetratricopeptide repeat protein [Bacteroidetes bacterium]|nr:tetratricopeptide repeat protein [Bacteroidota bacterium]HET6244098.1 tetratricopeptide repeat protein [Bacteroidia bacterium]
MYNPKILLVFICSFLLFSCVQKEQEEKIEDVVVAVSADSALVFINEKIKKNPNDPKLYHERAKYFLQTNGNIDAALSDMSRLFKLDSSKAEYFVTLSDLYFTKGLAGNVKAALEKALELEPENIDARMKLAELHLYLKNYKESIGNIDKILRIDKYNAKAYFIKGMAFKESGDTAKAVSSFQTTVEQDPDYYHAYMQLGLLFATQKNKLALDYYNNALKVTPNSIEAWYAAGVFCQENNMHKKAIESYFNILEIDTEHVYAHYNLGYVHSEYLKEYKTAIDHFSNALSFKPSYYEALYMRGYCYERLGDFPKALENYDLALKINPDYYLAYIGKSRVKKN